MNVEAEIARNKAIAQTLTNDPVILKAYDEAHRIASEQVDAQLGYNANENRPNRWRGNENDYPLGSLNSQPPPEQSGSSKPTQTGETANALEIKSPASVGPQSGGGESTRGQSESSPLGQPDQVQQPAQAGEPPPPPVRPVPEVPTPPAGPEGVGDPRTTGVANRVLSAEAIAGKIGAIEPGEGLSWQEMVDLGRASGINPQEVAQRFKQTGRLSYEEFAALRAERERMAIQSNELADRANAEPWNKDVQQALVNARKLETDFIRNVVQPAKTATSNIFRGMQGEAPIDATTFEGLRRAIVDATGKEPTQHQATVIRNRAAGARKIADSEARALKNTSRAIEQEFPKTKTPTLEQLKAEMERMAKELMPCKT